VCTAASATAAATAAAAASATAAAAVAAAAAGGGGGFCVVVDVGRDMGVVLHMLLLAVIGLLGLLLLHNLLVVRAVPGGRGLQCWGGSHISDQMQCLPLPLLLLLLLLLLGARRCEGFQRAHLLLMLLLQVVLQLLLLLLPQLLLVLVSVLLLLQLLLLMAVEPMTESFIHPQLLLLLVRKLVNELCHLLLC
jgi:hypothetical protein